MTTVESTTNLQDVVIAAGVGNRIRHTSGAEYVVGQSDSGEWNLTSPDDGIWTNEPLSTFISNGWSVANSDSLGEFSEDDDDDDEPEMVTRAEFFRTLDVGTIIRMTDGRTRYVYLGVCRNDEGERVFRLVDLRWGDALEYSESGNNDSESENDWAKIETETGWETVDPNHLRALQTIQTVRGDNRQWQKSVDELAEKQDRIMADFQIVNDKLCEFAVDKGYCPEFEEVIGRWNQELKELEILGRPRQFAVYIGIPDTSVNMPIYVTARSEKQAQQDVSQMNTRAILEKMLADGSYFDGLRFNVLGLEDEGVDN